MKKNKKLITLLLVTIISSIIIGFLPSNCSIIPNSNLNYNFLNSWIPPEDNEPVDKINPIEPENSEITTLDQYNPPAFTGSGKSYTVTESFDEIVKYGTTVIWTGTNVQVPVDSGYPSQAASRFSGLITNLIEHNDKAYDAQFTGANTDGFTTYTSPQGDDGVDTSVTHPGGVYRIGFQGHTSNINDARYGSDMYFTGSSWSIPSGEEKWQYDGGPPYYAPEAHSDGYYASNWRFRIYERGTQTCEWLCASYTQNAQQSAGDWVVKSGDFYHNLDFSGSDTGYALSQARIHINYNIYPGGSGWDHTNDRYKLYVGIAKDDAFLGWDNYITYRAGGLGSATSGTGWKTITADVSSTDQNTKWNLYFRFTARAYSGGYNDPQDLYCEIDDVYLTIDYVEAEEFYHNTEASIRSATYEWEKDTINGNLTFGYFLSSNWGSSWANSRAKMRIYISSSALNGGAGTYITPPGGWALSTFTSGTNSTFAPIDITEHLGAGTIMSFYFEFEIYWDLGVGNTWGPLLDEWLYFDIDWVNFNFDANVMPSDADLWLKDTSDNSFLNITGMFTYPIPISFSWSKAWSSGSNPVFEWEIRDPWFLGTVASYFTSATVTITYGNLAMTQSVDISPATTTYSATANATKINWYFYYITCIKDDARSDGSEVVTITGVPSDYTAVSVSGSHGEQVFPSAPSGSLIVNGSNSGDFYILTAQSDNYLLPQVESGEIRFMENSTGNFEYASIVYPSNWTSVRVNAPAAGYVNLTIVNASRTLANGTTWDFGVEYQELLQSSPQVNSTPWIIPDDAIPGIWTVILIWNNSLNAANLDHIGMVSISVDVRRRTTTTPIMFSQKYSGLIGDGSDPSNPANVTVDGDPLYINITWFDDYWGKPVNYCEKANVTISADYEPYNDEPPYTTKEFKMTRDGGTFYFLIDDEDYGVSTPIFTPGWCYTGLHTFTIELFSNSTVIDGQLAKRTINGSFFVKVDVSLEISLPDPDLVHPDEYTQGTDHDLWIILSDVSHNKVIDSTSPYYSGLVTANWTLALGNESDNILVRWNGPPYGSTPYNGTLTQKPKFPGVYEGLLDIDPNCMATNSESLDWWEQYYYLNFTAVIAPNVSLDWEFEEVYCMSEFTNDTERMVGTPYEKPTWTKFAVAEARLRFITGAEPPTWLAEPSVYWYDWDNNEITLYVRYFNLEDNISKPLSGLNSYVGLVNSTHYNKTISQREGNVSYLRATTADRGYAGDIYVKSESSESAWTAYDWQEAIEYRWKNDSGGNYDLVPEIDETGYTGNLIKWNETNNYTWGWYYHNFTINKSSTGKFLISITCYKLESYWYNESSVGGADKYKFAPARTEIEIEVKRNLVVLTQRDNFHLIHEYPTSSIYYWNETLTLNLTAWDAINNGTITPSHPDGVWKVGNFSLEYDLIDTFLPLNPLNVGIGIPETSIEGVYAVSYSTYPLYIDNETLGKDFKFRISGALKNYVLDDDGSEPISDQIEIVFRLYSRPTLLEGIKIKGVMESTKNLAEIEKIYKEIELDIVTTHAKYYIPKNRIFTMSIQYNDTSRSSTGGIAINDAETWINITYEMEPALGYQTWVDNFADNLDGIYNYTVNTTGLDPFKEYRVIVSARKKVTFLDNYRYWDDSPPERYFDLEPIRIPVVMEAVNYPVVTQGAIMYIILRVHDPTASGDNPKNLGGAQIEYEIKGPGINMALPLRGFMIPLGVSGYYITTLDTWTSLFDFNLPGTFFFEARLRKFSSDFDPNGDYGNYEDYDTAAMLTSQGNHLVLYINSAGIFGPLTMSIFTGLIGGIVVAGAYLSYETFRILRIPYPLRMIDDSSKKIKRRRKTHAGIMKSREQQVVEEAETKLSMLGVKLEPISPKKLPPPITKVFKKKEEVKELPALTEEQIKAELDAIKDLTTEERLLFLKEIKGLSPNDQREFIAGLKGEPKGTEPKKE